MGQVEVGWYTQRVKKTQHDHVWASEAISVILSANGHSKQSFYLVGMFNADFNLNHS